MLSLLKQVKAGKTPLQMVVLGRNYERLTLVTGLKMVDDQPSLLVDCPVGFGEDVREPEGARVRLECLGRDRIQYAFRSSIRAVFEKDILLDLPEWIERIQRRRHFRIAPPLGTTISFGRNGAPLKATVINLSEGGALLFLNDARDGKPFLWIGAEVWGMSMGLQGLRSILFTLGREATMQL